MAQKKVMLAVGHGNRPNGTFDPGAVKGEWSEQVAMDVTIGAAAASLRKDGRLRVYDEAYQEDPNFVGTIDRANELRVHAVISGHQDWSGGIREFFGFWWPNSADGERLTRAILESYKENGLPLNASWTKARSDLSLLRRTRMAATLIEHGRVGDPWVEEPGKLEAIGRWMAQGILSYFGLEGTAPPPVDDGISDDPSVTGTYTVRPGDTLGAIAEAHGADVSALARLNDIDDPNLIYPGQVIRFSDAVAPAPPKVRIPPFPLPRGHWYGEPMSNPRNHSGYYWSADRAGIRQAQQRLRDRGWRISVDGRFGPQTKDVVVSFQREKGLTVDGLIGPQTWRALWAEPIT